MKRKDIESVVQRYEGKLIDPYKLISLDSGFLAFDSKNKKWVLPDSSTSEVKPRDCVNLLGIFVESLRQLGVRRTLEIYFS